MTGEWTTYNLTAAAMYRYLDREAIEKRRAKKAERFFRKIKNLSLRKFAQAIKHEIVHDPKCNESDIRKKVISRCKISARSYYSYLEILHKP